MAKKYISITEQLRQAILTADKTRYRHMEGNRCCGGSTLSRFVNGKGGLAARCHRQDRRVSGVVADHRSTEATNEERQVAMASISRESNGRKTIQFKTGDGRRKSMRLGKVSMKTAREVKGRVRAYQARGEPR